MNLPHEVQLDLKQIGLAEFSVLVGPQEFRLPCQWQRTQLEPFHTIARELLGRRGKDSSEPHSCQHLPGSLWFQGLLWLDLTYIQFLRDAQYFLTRG